MRALITTVTLLALSGSALAQQGVRAQSPRRDAGQHALRMIAESQANRNIGQPSPFVGPSNVAPRYGHSYGHSIFQGHGGFHGQIHRRSHDIIHVGRSPFIVYNGGYYRYRGYDPFYEPTRRQVVQSPTVIIIDRTGVQTNEVDPAEPIEITDADRVSPRELGRAALVAGNSEQAVRFLTEHVLVNEGDRRAERLLGVALVLDGQTELGIAVIGRAYRGDPELAFEPLGRDTIDSLAAWRRVQRDVQRYASVQRTASAWLAAIAVTQAELPNRTHEERLEQARRAGLGVDVVDAFQRYLEGGEPITKPEPVQPAEEAVDAEEAEPEGGP
ncbi:MAG: hypothetical protein RIE77_03925 [Phycisphaerales bacterium]|jgi:hypothetical protein